MVHGQIRSADIAGRYGGKKFCVMLPNTLVNGSLVIAEFSGEESIKKILNAADAALYRAKQGGRKKVA
jgi:PleD family two-component response regulator